MVLIPWAKVNDAASYDTKLVAKYDAMYEVPSEYLFLS